MASTPQYQSSPRHAPIQTIIATGPQHKTVMRWLQALAPIVIVPVSVFALTIVSASEVQARAKCHKGFQIVAGTSIATPLCQDRYLAKVAREYGSRVSAKAIKHNPNVKKQVCLLIGHDIRVQNHCRATTPRFRSR